MLWFTPVFMKHSPDFRRSPPVFMCFYIMAYTASHFFQATGPAMPRFSCVLPHWEAPRPIFSKRMDKRSSGFHVSGG